MYGLVYGQVEIYWSSLHSELVDRYEISISQMTMAVFPLLSLLPMKDMADCFIKQELLVLLVNLYSSLLRLRSVLLIFLFCCVVFLWCFCGLFVFGLLFYVPHVAGVYGLSILGCLYRFSVWHCVCVVFCFLFFVVFFLCLMYLMSQVSLDCSFLIAPLVFLNVNFILFI